MPQALPTDVRRLISEHIVSVEQLEILLLLRRESNAVWTARQVSDRIRSTEWSAARRLEDLTASGLVAPSSDDPPSYRYAPADANLRAAVDGLAQAYAERPYSIIELIFSKPIDNLCVYSDAFLFKRRKHDG